MDKQNGIRFNLKDFNLNHDADFSRVRTLADSYLNEKGLSFRELDALAAGDELFPALAAFLARSKKRLAGYGGRKARLAILMNLVHEHHRLAPASLTNPNGENSLENKLAQLEWIFEGTGVDYHLVYVSGSCPWGSDGVLEQQIQRTGSSGRVSHFIMDEGPEKEPEGISYTPNCKGGEMIYGIRSILQKSGYPDAGAFDALLFTDADMSFDLAQAGSLMAAYFEGSRFIIGDRMHPQSILLKNMTRAGSGILVYRHIQRKLTPRYFLDRKLHDTQCPWKFLSLEAARRIEGKLDCMDWSIDTDIIGAAEYCHIPMEIQPVTFIDSEKESHGKAIGHYCRNRTIIEGNLRQNEKYSLPFDQNMARLVKTYLKKDEDYRLLLESGLPPGLENLENRAWGISPQITDELMEEWLGNLGKQKV